jgi:hypothetical protein
MPSKVHPADEAAARLIAGAERFEIALFRGQGSYAKAGAATLDEARAAAARLEAEVANGRPALIYALDAGVARPSSPATSRQRRCTPCTRPSGRSLGYDAIKLGFVPYTGYDAPLPAVRHIEKLAAAVRERVGEAVDIMTDFHGRPDSLDGAKAYIDAIAPIRPLFVEEPIQPGDTPAIADLAPPRRLSARDW